MGREAAFLQNFSLSFELLSLFIGPNRPSSHLHFIAFSKLKSYYTTGNDHLKKKNLWVYQDLNLRNDFQTRGDSR